MCGIAGVANLNGRLEPARLRGLASAMAEALRHRGPDDHGVWQDAANFCALSHRRLSIIDTSAAGHQPMLLPNGSALTFNGEIYNYQALRKEMKADGVRVTSVSDSEVLLKGLDHYGLDFVTRLDGMYAFGFFDAKTRELWLARDNFGEKPLYYAQQNGLFTFASELNALTLQEGFDASIDLDTIAMYFALQYLPAPQTIYRNAYKLPPGHFGILKPDGSFAVRRHYTFRTSDAVKSGRSLDDLADELESIFVDTVRTRLISDVPLGAFLSSGVDSSAVCAIVTKKLGLPLQTFSMGFTGSAKSEHTAAQQMADHLGTAHHSQVIDYEAVGLGRHIGQILDEPNGDNSCLPTYLLSQYTRQHVTVALSGDGGDEMFGGYGRYFDTLRDEAAGNTAWRPGEAYYSGRILIMADHVIEKFLGKVPPGTAAWLASHRRDMNGDPRPLINKMREADALDYMPGAVLAKVDRMSMQHALEIRAPLLGRAVADFAMKLAAGDCYGDGQGKLVLKQLAQRFIPREWLDRPKLGFGIALQDWNGASLAAATRDLLLGPESRLGQSIPAPLMKGFCDFHAKTPMPHHLWPVYILEIWLRNHPATPAS